jgi:hypothetical protein
LSLKDATSSRSGKSSVEDMAIMLIGVVIEPNKEHEFVSKIFLERVSEEKINYNGLITRRLSPTIL